MDDANLYGLMMEDEPTAQEHAQALAAALRRQRAQAGDDQQFGLMAQMTGDRVLSGVGKSMQSNAQSAFEQAGRQEQQLGQVGERRLLRKVEADRNAALAQWRGEEEARKAAGTVRAINAPDGTTLGLNNVTGEVTPLHTSTKKLAPVGAGAGAPGAAFDPATVDMLARKSLSNGELRDFGAGKQGFALRTAVLKRMGELQPNADLAGASADYKANRSSLSALQGQKDKSDILENTALRNLEVAVSQAEKLGGAGIPILNLPYQRVRAALGDEKMAAYDAARQATVGEAGKLLNGSLGNGGLTEGARHEVERLLQPGASIGQIKAAAGIIRTDIANRQAAAGSQISEVRGRMGGKSPEVRGGDMKAKASARVRELIDSGVTDKAAIRAQLEKEGIKL